MCRLLRNPQVSGSQNRPLHLRTRHNWKVLKGSFRPTLIAFFGRVMKIIDTLSMACEIRVLVRHSKLACLVTQSNAKDHSYGVAPEDFSGLQPLRRICYSRSVIYSTTKLSQCGGREAASRSQPQVALHVRRHGTQTQAGRSTILPEEVSYSLIKEQSQKKQTCRNHCGIPYHI